MWTPSHTYTHIKLSFHPGGTQLLLDRAADKTGGSSFMFSRASTEWSLPDGSVHHVFSPAPQSAWLEPLSQQCSQFSESHGSHGRGEERLLLMVPAQITQANKKPETDNQNQRTHEWLNHPFPLYHTYLLLLQNPAVVCVHHRHQPPLSYSALTCISLWPWIRLLN